MSSRPEPLPADVCLIVEGAYPHVTGGVSSWVHDLLTSQSHLTFHLLVIVAPGADRTLRYKLPANVAGLTHVVAADLPDGRWYLRGGGKLVEAIHRPVARLMNGGDAEDLREILALLQPYRHQLGRQLLLDSRAAWEAFNRTYAQACAGASYLNTFWGWRTLVAGLFSTLLCDLPPARLYHCVSTGYAGLLAARAALETGRPALVTEHGVYTNERRLEILAASWLGVDDSHALTIDGEPNKVKQLWIETFVAYSRVCYQTSARILTLFEGNHALQIEDGARPDRLDVIPNGIDVDQLSAIVRQPGVGEGGTRPPTIGLLGRVVPIKDIKTYLRACALLVPRVPDVVCYVLGPMDEDPEYAAACQALAAHLGLQDHVRFTGMVRPSDYYGQLDVLVLTSISEAQPLVLLEAGAAGVPSVATDVGACREMLLGRADETPPLGPGGHVTPIGHPAAIADAIADLLLNEPRRQAFGRAMRQRVRQSYDKSALHLRYARLYAELAQQPDAAPALRPVGT